MSTKAEEAAARIGILRHDGRYPDFFAGYRAAAESRDLEIARLERLLAKANLEVLESHRFEDAFHG